MKDGEICGDDAEKNMNNPDEVRNFPEGKVAVVNVGGLTFGLATFDLGWKRSESVDPIVTTESSQVLHNAYQLSRRMHVITSDGTKQKFGPGDVAVIPSGHDAWNVGNESAVVLDISGMADYAKQV